MQLTVSLTNSEELLQIDFPAELTVEDLTAYLQDQLEILEFSIIFQNATLDLPTATLDSLNIKEHDLIFVQPKQELKRLASSPALQPVPRFVQNAPPIGLSPHSAISDPIQQSLERAFENNPESFTQIKMLYVPITLHPQGHNPDNKPTPAFVDTGAQTSIISPAHARAMGVDHLIDVRFKGQARGVGSSEILGRIHDVEVSLGDVMINLGFTVLDTGMDLLLGLDMMRKYGMCVDLGANCLRVEGMKVPFLSDSETPDFAEALKTGGTMLGGGNIFSPGAFDGTSGAATRNSSVTTNVKNAAEAARKAAMKRQSNPQATQQSTGTSSSISTNAPPSFPEESITQLTSLGFTRAQAIGALQACQGNVEVAASLLFQ